MEEKVLKDKLRLIEALFAGAATAGERDAAASALERIRKRLETFQQVDPPIEYHFSMSDMWSRRLFSALLRRYGIRPYRYSRQRYTTVMAKVSKRFVDETLWPEFQEMNRILRSYIDEITDRLITEDIYADDSEPEIRHELPGRAG
jgi:hypothetical protein